MNKNDDKFVISDYFHSQEDKMGYGQWRMTRQPACVVSNHQGGNVEKAHRGAS